MPREASVPTAEEIRTRIGRRVRQLRREKNLTIDAVAGAAHVSVDVVSQTERATSLPTLGSLLVISDALGCTIEEIVNDQVLRDGGEQQPTTVLGRRARTEAKIDALLASLDDDALDAIARMVAAVRPIALREKV